MISSPASTYHLNYRNLILSDEQRYRRLRQTLFWIFYLCYFYLQSIGPKNYQDIFRASTYSNAFLNLLCFSPVSIVIIYVFKGPIMMLIKQRRYLAFALLFLSIFLAGTSLNYFASWIYLSIAGDLLEVPNYFYKRLEIASWNTRWAMILGVIVTGLQLARQWFLQATENLEMVKTTARAETKIQKSRIHPDWLFASLNKIRQNLHSDAGEKITESAVYISAQKPDPTQSFHITASADMILHLSDILSYSLYECDEDLVPLAREMEEIQQLVSLEQKNKSRINHIELTITGNSKGEMIPPMSVLNRVIDHVTELTARTGNTCTLHLQFAIQPGSLKMSSSVNCDGVNET
ncbi:MAG: histidine kinase, partial [Pedobacter sp.]